FPVALGWNPLGPKSLICSRTAGSYKASLENGLMPLWKRRCFGEGRCKSFYLDAPDGGEKLVIEVEYVGLVLAS
ncbi:MAG: hypothetical protein LBK74_09900, partial [Treponema sp.]|nr:hypothetical protein [Treponema sp.]